MKHLILLMFLLCSVNVFGQVNIAKVKNVNINADTGGGYIIFSEVVATKHCSGTGDATYTHLGYTVDPKKSPGGKALYSAALTAFATGSNVYITTKDRCAEPWQSNVQEIKSLMLMQ